MPEQIGYLKTLGLDYGWGPTALVEWTLEHIHVLAGTPWWVSITLTAVAFRAIMFKPYINAAENGTKLATIMPIIKPLQAQMSEASRAGKPDEVWKLRQELQMINKRAGIQFYKTFIPFLQVFVGYGTFVLLRAMAHLPVPGLETGGMLWFTNLTVPDPMFLFPIGTSFVLHWVLRVRLSTHLHKTSLTQTRKEEKPAYRI
jgi:YidC/Oxa1 family membrane protein insertase